jgi:hypothetical protein
MLWRTGDWADFKCRLNSRAGDPPWPQNTHGIHRAINNRALNPDSTWPVIENEIAWLKVGTECTFDMLSL